MDRDRELVEEVKEVMRSTFSSPSLAEVKGDWYIFEKTGRTPIVSRDVEGSRDGVSAVAWFRIKGWTVTPVVMHKVTAFR